MLSMLKDPNDMMTIGPVIEKQQKIINDCVEKKLTLSKLQSSVWEKSNSSKVVFSISDLDVDGDIIQNLLEKDISKPNDSYKINK